MFAAAVASLASLALVGGCAPPPDHATKAQNGLDPAKWTALMDRAADLVVADQADCGKMAKDIEDLLKTNAALVAAANQAMTDEQKLPDDASARISSDVQRMMPGVDACGADGPVKKAFKLAKPADDES
nr:hypothetical protein [Kofleriaceae bacterium]